MFAYDISSGSPVSRQKSPLEKDVWFMPANSTDVKPPDFNPETHFAQYDGSSWAIHKIPLLPDLEEEESGLPVIPNFPEYKLKRLEEYGGVLEQIEYITENGLEAWQAHVASVKEKYPKPKVEYDDSPE